jgi:hypothetical protein
MTTMSLSSIAFVAVSLRIAQAVVIDRLVDGLAESAWNRVQHNEVDGENLCAGSGQDIL